MLFAHLQSLHLPNSSIDEVMCVGWATAEIDPQIPQHSGGGSGGLHPEEGAHTYIVHLQSAHVITICFL